MGSASHKTTTITSRCWNFLLDLTFSHVTIQLKFPVRVSIVPLSSHVTDLIKLLSGTKSRDKFSTARLDANPARVLSQAEDGRRGRVGRWQHAETASSDERERESESESERERDFDF